MIDLEKVNKKLCIGLLTYCDSNSQPERFNILKKSVDSLRNLKQDNVYIYVWDNASSKEVRDFLMSKDFFDALYFSKQNMYDLIAVQKLAQESKKINSEYVCHLEDDFYFYKNDFISPCLKFLDENQDCGYLRISEYDFHNKKKYDKASPPSIKDGAHAQRHYNTITGKKIEWKHVGQLSNYNFYKNNWHWSNFANICRAKVFQEIIPKRDTQPLQGLERRMMEKYNSLKLKTGVLDLGAASHLGLFTPQTSQRILAEQQHSLGKVCIKYEEILQEIKNVTKTTKQT